MNMMRFNVGKEKQICEEILAWSAHTLQKPNPYYNGLLLPALWTGAAQKGYYDNYLAEYNASEIFEQRANLYRRLRNGNEAS